MTSMNHVLTAPDTSLNKNKTPAQSENSVSHQRTAGRERYKFGFKKSPSVFQELPPLPENNTVHLCNEKLQPQ